MKYNIGDILTQIATGKVFNITDYQVTPTSMYHVSYYYDLYCIADGSTLKSLTEAELNNDFKPSSGLSFGIDPGFHNLLPTESHLELECNHSWVKYHGLNDQYEFCSKCDEKKK